MGNKWIATGAFLMAMVIGLGAFGAHGLKDLLEPASLDSYKTAVLYQMIHALAIILVGIISAQKSIKMHAAGYLFLAGIILFSGSIYLLSTQGITQMNFKFLGPITPLGGTLFMAGWTVLGISMLRKKANNNLN